ncbi:ABC transporter ATP-binding protein [Candidatus Thiothrix anitrata]|uniref:ABC transporter ATP-binding protein n=1 Tax=Candidatus Thiothrix anitrata TaxID=2823902 RepID=A0ABX7X1Y5_9GAMM|nr:ABC transporter ATP-binding protein [Candidatus Thiothrix anitrata]QTR49392.1 ABC transporter ATP-binding protein [Candidatus Thiothrix anitrata]
MIKLESVSKRYNTRNGQYTVLDQVDLTIEKGERIGILGRNGSGKSTLIRLISGADQPSSGKITRNMSVSWPLAFSGGFQGGLSGLDNLKFICRIYGQDYKQHLEAIKEFSELGSFLYEPIKNYSSGMKARLAFAISMSIEFDCFLIDEVISVGDKRFQDRCKSELFDKRGDRAMIMVSHEVQNIKKYCASAYVLRENKLHHFYKIDDAYSFYNHDITP